MIGPPIAALPSYCLRMPGVCVSVGFSAWMSDVRLLLRPQLPDPLMKPVPANRLPPDFGTMFITGPPLSLSPSPPPTVMATSYELRVSYSYDQTPPLRAAPT